MRSKKLSLNRFRQKKTMLCLSLVAAAMISTGFTTQETSNVRIDVDGKTLNAHFEGVSPAEILRATGVKLGAKDEFDVDLQGNQTNISVRRAVPVTIVSDGVSRQLLTAKATVGDVLNELGYAVEEYDADPSRDAKVVSGMKIRLKESEALVEAKKAEVAAEEERLRQIQEREEAEKAAELALKEADELAAQLQAEQEAQYAEENYYTDSYSDSPSYGGYAIEMEATAYLPTDGDGYGITATGIPATYGVAAVDPYVIPLGSRLYIPGYGEAIAADTGGAIVGNRIDLCMESYGEAMSFGRRYVTVYVVE